MIFGFDWPKKIPPARPGSSKRSLFYWSHTPSGVFILYPESRVNHPIFRSGTLGPPWFCKPPALGPTRRTRHRDRRSTRIHNSHHLGYHHPCPPPGDHPLPLSTWRWSGGCPLLCMCVELRSQCLVSRVGPRAGGLQNHGGPRGPLLQIDLLEIFLALFFPI